MTRRQILIFVLVIIGIFAASLILINRRNLLDKPAAHHAADYSWVVGRLDYSQIEGGFWIIRYENQTDQFGGKFVLGRDSKLEGFADGDLVKITGQIAQNQVSIYQAGTLYQIDSIQRLR